MTNYSFSTALEMIRQGERMQRAGWNGKGMFIYFVPAASYPAGRNALGTLKGMFEDDMVPYGAYIAMKTADDNVVPWLASQTDLLANDWQIATFLANTRETPADDDGDLPTFKMPPEIRDLFEAIHNGDTFSTEQFELAATWFRDLEDEISRPVDTTAHQASPFDLVKIFGPDMAAGYQDETPSQCCSSFELDMINLRCRSCGEDLI